MSGLFDGVLDGLFNGLDDDGGSDGSPRFDRRRFLVLAGATTLAAELPGCLGCDADAENEGTVGADQLLVTEIEAMQPTVDALQYTNSSEKHDQRCANCRFYSSEGEGRGDCEFFAQGLVVAEGWCASWSKKRRARP